MKDKIVAIHQPNFFPWLGYFNKIANSDAFVLLDNAQFSKTGGSWTNRVKVIVSGKPNWITVPIVRSYHGYRLINEIKINDMVKWRKKMLRTIRTNYARASYFKDIFPLLQELINYPTNYLSDFNINIIKKLISVLKIKSAELIKSSSLKIQEKGTKRLIALTKAIGGSAYLCGGGASEYQEDWMFKERKLKLIYQNFNHPIYSQFNTKKFTAGLSIIDALMNHGFIGVRKIIFST